MHTHRGSRLFGGGGDCLLLPSLLWPDNASSDQPTIPKPLSPSDLWPHAHPALDTHPHLTIDAFWEKADPHPLQTDRCLWKHYLPPYSIWGHRLCCMITKYDQLWLRLFSMRRFWTIFRMRSVNICNIPNLVHFCISEKWCY